MFIYLAQSAATMSVKRFMVSRPEKMLTITSTSLASYLHRADQCPIYLYISFKSSEKKCRQNILFVCYNIELEDQL